MKAKQAIQQAAVLSVLAALAAPETQAQTYVTPKMGGGQVAADMVHIDLYYDDGANEFYAHVDDSYGTPELRALDAGTAFDPQASYAVLNGKAYNAQYGWNAGGLFSIPAGAAIWIEPIDATPGLEVYADWGRYGSYAPIFGTAGSPRRWKWSGVMVHNTYAVFQSTTDRLFAEYHIYFGDAVTGSRAGFEQYDDVFVRLEWTTVAVEDPLTFKFGARALIHGAPLCFLNASNFVVESEFVLNLGPTNAGLAAPVYACSLPLLAVPATATNGGPATNHAALGSCLEFEVRSLTGPRGAQLAFWEAGEAQPRFAVDTGAVTGTNRFRLSQNQGAPGADPYGRICGRRLTVSQPGLYALGFRLLDVSSNGAGSGPIHAPSDTYRFYLQAGLSVATLTQAGQGTTITFGGERGRVYYLERTLELGPAARWQTVAGPRPGTNCLQRLTDAGSAPEAGFYRVRVAGP